MPIATRNGVNNLSKNEITLQIVCLELSSSNLLLICSYLAIRIFSSLLSFFKIALSLALI
jgi:hypothetical protein